MTVKELIPQIEALDGRTVAVKGFLSLCSGYDCHLFEDKGDSDKWDRMIDAIRAKRRPFPPEPPVLGIGNKLERNGDFDKAFDRKAEALSYSYVVVTGKITKMCRHRGLPGCTDRSTDIWPTQIEAWHRAAPAGNEKSRRQ